MVKLEMTVRTKKQLIVVGILLLGMLYAALSQKMSLGQAYQQVMFNDSYLCSIHKGVDVEELAQKVRRQIAVESTDKLAIDYKISVTETRKPFVSFAFEQELEELLKEQMQNAAINGGVRSYTLGIEGYRASFASLEEVKELFSGVKAEVDTELAFEPVIKKQEGHIKGILTASLEEVGVETATSLGQEFGNRLTSGVMTEVVKNLADITINPKKEEYQTGILDMEFIEQITIYESFVAKEELADVQTELSEVTKEKETNKIYVVKSGDSLSVIAYENDTTVDSIVALNGMKDANQMIRIDDELIIAVPEPDLMLRVTTGEVYEEDYHAEPVLILNDTWYTTKEVVHQEGTVGYRERNDIVVTENGIEVSREMVQEKILVESQPSIVERGTVIPPTYIKPVNGGTKTSGYGRRWGRLHKGVDWAVPVGTTVFASSAGKVVRADYNGAYGNCVLISHSDGRMTRYAHNSKLLVSAGDYVEQGEAIALSGNTGRSTGPHVHFEMIINGVAVDPLKYIN